GRARRSTGRFGAVVCPILLGGLLAAIDAPPAAAQSAGLLAAPERPPLPDFAVPESPGRPVLPPLEGPTAPDAASAAAAGEGLQIDRIVFEGNRALDTRTLADVAAPFLGRPLRAGELAALRDALTRAYVERGYVSSGARLPEQQIVDGTLRVEIVEGRLGRIDVTTDGRLRPSFVDRGLFRRGQLVSVPQIEDRLRGLEQDPRVDAVVARLLPGERAGEATLDLALVEARAYWLEAAFGNTTPPTVGALGGDFRAGHRNVLGFSDALEVGYRRTEGLESFLVGYDVPISPFGTRLGFRFSNAESEVVDGPLEDADIQSRSRTFAFELSQPLVRGARQNASLFLRAEHRRAKAFLFGTGEAALAEGSEEGETTVAVLRAGGEWAWRDARQALALRTTLSVGLDTLGATMDGEGAADAEFVTGLFQAQWAARLTDWNLQAVARLDGQVADSRLFGLERFAVGGYSTVRGYRENQLVRDHGVVGSLELRVPIWRDPGRDLEIALAPFVDAGGGWNASRTRGQTTLASAGIGLRADWRPWIAARLYWGQALLPVRNAPDDDPQDAGIHFLLTFRPDWDTVAGWLR
ncbi:MAG TPA: ShlB/FhaC/HecB family hemolysin secretion/activation protein, partial [Myxococcota bacterium]|nr:ShlB/FhaC/HecB family hemolysin secretion/activation protein [Myxococcota bacterium]